MWSAALALLLHERRVAPRPVPGGDHPDGSVDVVVPARDEERAIGACVASLLAQGPVVGRVVVVDDGSRDGTAAAARRAAAGDPRLDVVPAGDLPDGWIGKNWAAWTGVRRTSAPWLLFCDADVVHAPGTVAAALGLAAERGASGVTLLPRVDCGTRAERWVIPAAFVAISTFVAPGPLARAPWSPVAVAAGAFILVERGAYLSVGGHRAMRGRMVDDITLATRLKRSGRMLVPADGTASVHLRMYHGARDLWSGWRKNASFATLGSPAAALAGGLLVAAAGVTPGVALTAGVIGRRPGLALRGLAGVAALAALQRAAGSAVPTPRRDALTLPVGLVVLAAAAAQGAVDRTLGRGAVWRGRRYAHAR